MRRPPAKHSVFFGVVEAMQRPGCFLCRLEQQAVVQQLDALLYECVNDPALRSRLREGGGFCAAHGHLLLEMGDAMGVAILFRDQVIDAADQVSRPAGRARGAETACPSCATRDAARERHLACFAEFGDDPAFREAVAGLVDLCLPHWRAIDRAARSSGLRNLLRETMEMRLAELRRDLDEFLRKQDHRFRGEPISDAEARSWICAVQLRVGWTFPKHELLRRR